VPLPLCAAAVVFVLAFAALLVSHRTQPLALGRPQAVSAFRADPQMRTALARTAVTRIQVLPGDSVNDQVFAYDGGRLVATAEVSRTGVVTGRQDLTRSSFAFGANIANAPWVLALLCAVFVLVTAVWPWRRLRNLDVALATALVAPLVLFNHWLLADSAIAGYPLLCYVACRCAWVALRGAGTAPASVPLIVALTRAWEPARRRRLLVWIAVTCGLVVAMVGFTSPNIIDVGYALMEGATRITHGLLPYGHISDIAHGDTYPIGSYVLYVPFALLTPVDTVFDNANLVLVVAIVAALAIAWALARLPRATADDTNGLRAAIAWLTFPTVLVTVSTGTSDVLLGAMVVLAFVLWRRPAAATGALAVAGWFKLAPFALLPVALARLRGGGLRRSLAVLAALSAAMLALIVALGGTHGVSAMATAIGYQQTRTSPHAIWPLIGSVPLQQLAEAGTLAVVAAATVLCRTDAAFAADRHRLAALFAAVLLGIQISANYWSYLYLTWVVPLVLLSLLADS
jgi:hypothetical protein